MIIYMEIWNIVTLLQFTRVSGGNISVILCKVLLNKNQYSHICKWCMRGTSGVEFRVRQDLPFHHWVWTSFGPTAHISGYQEWQCMSRCGAEVVPLWWVYLCHMANLINQLRSCIFILVPQILTGYQSHHHHHHHDYYYLLVHHRSIKKLHFCECRYYRVLMMVYNTQRYWVFGLCPSSGFFLTWGQTDPVSETLCFFIVI
jgi:hypothetical protein